MGLIRFDDFAEIGALLERPDVSLTVFAPNNAAMENLDVSDVDLINAVFRYHILGEELYEDDFLVLQFPDTLMIDQRYVNNGRRSQVLDVYHNDDQLLIFFRDQIAKVVTSNVRCSNGVIHVIDKLVLLPEKALQTARDSGFSKFYELVHKADLQTDIDEMDGATVLVPTDEAWAAIPDIDTWPISSLAQLLTYHIAFGAFYSPELKNGMELIVVERNHTLLVTKTQGPTGDIINIADALVSRPNVLTHNGVIHGLDTVLFPPFHR